MSDNETRIDSLSGGISDEDAKLVDSILNDLGQGPQPQQQQQQQMTPEQQQAMAQQQMLAQQQQQLQQQQAMQQQGMQQAMQQQGAQHPQMNGPSVSSSIMDDIKVEAKSIIVIMVLCILLNLDQVNELFQKITMFVGEGGCLNMQCVFVKAILIGIIFFFIKTKLIG